MYTNHILIRLAVIAGVTGAAAAACALRKRKAVRRPDGEARTLNTVVIYYILSAAGILCSVYSSVQEYISRLYIENMTGETFIFSRWKLFGVIAALEMICFAAGCAMLAKWRRGPDKSPIRAAYILLLFTCCVLPRQIGILIKLAPALEMGERGARGYKMLPFIIFGLLLAAFALSRLCAGHLQKKGFGFGGNLSRARFFLFSLISGALMSAYLSDRSCAIYFSGCCLSLLSGYSVLRGLFLKDGSNGREHTALVITGALGQLLAALSLVCFG